MRVLERNKQDIWYANPTGFVYAEDSNGFKTGEKTISYETPVKTRMSMDGISTGYTHRAVTEDLNCSMGEESRVWFGIEPTRIVIVDGKETEIPVSHNFEVVRKAKSLNHLIYYLKEVDVQ